MKNKNTIIQRFSSINLSGSPLFIFIINNTSPLPLSRGRGERIFSQNILLWINVESVIVRQKNCSLQNISYLRTIATFDLLVRDALIPRGMGPYSAALANALAGIQ